MHKEIIDALEVLGNRNRLHIVMTLYDSEGMSAVDFAAGLEISTTAVVKHLNILEHVGFITRKKVGRKNICTLSRDMMDFIKDWPDMLEVSWLDMLTLEGE